LLPHQRGSFRPICRTSADTVPVFPFFSSLSSLLFLLFSFFSSSTDTPHQLDRDENGSNQRASGLSGNVRGIVPDNLHPAGAVTIWGWIRDMIEAAEHDDVEAFARLALMVAGKVKLELEWYAMVTATPVAPISHHHGIAPVYV
jgi:hypothetical protein